MRKFWLLSLFAAGSCVALAWYVQATRLYLNGNPISSGILERGGVAYVPLKDVASAFHLSVQKTSRGYELADSGGANQVEGVTGKIGDMLFNGIVRFQVLKVTRSHTYTTQFEANSREIDPIQSGNDLVIVRCKVKNGTQKTLYPNLADEDAVAVTDTDGHSYSVRRFSDFPPNHDMLPGAAIDYALIFEAPPSAKLQDLVYAVTSIGIPGAEKKKFRISIAEGG